MRFLRIFLLIIFIGTGVALGDSWGEMAKSFRDSLQSLHEGMGFFAVPEHPPGTVYKRPLDSKQKAQALSLLKAGIEASKHVTDRYLTKMDPELPHQYRQNLVAAARAYVRALEHSGNTPAGFIQEELAASKQFDAWRAWMFLHKDTLRYPEPDPEQKAPN